MSDHDPPPEFRQRKTHREALWIEVPLEEEIPPPLLNPDRNAAEQSNPEPFLRRS